MGNHILAICDDQIVYSELLAKRWMRKEEDYYQICRFTTEEQLKTFAREQEIECLLVSETMEYLVQQVAAKGYFCFSSTKSGGCQGLTGEENLYYIYRYQSSDEIYNLIREVSGKTEDRAKEAVRGGGNPMEEEVRLIGIYNPVHRNGQTLYAKALARSLGKKGKRVLYLSMEEYAGNVPDGCGDLGEVLFYLKQDVKNVSMHLTGMVKVAEGYDYVEPIGVSQELKGIKGEEWLAFLLELKERSGYHRIILDLDGCVEGLLEILELCAQVYMPIQESVGGEAKRKQFFQNLILLQREALGERIQSEVVPTFAEEDESRVLERLEQVVAHIR